MLKMVVQQGRSRWKHRRRSPWLRWGCFRGENDAGGLFQHPVRKIAAAYCEALPILVQQRPYASM